MKRRRSAPRPAGRPWPRRRYRPRSPRSTGRAAALLRAARTRSASRSLAPEEATDRLHVARPAYGGRIEGQPRYVRRDQVGDVGGAVVAVDVLRAFTTAAYAFAAGANHIYLCDSVEEALTFKAGNLDVLVMGEDHGRRVTGFDFSNSPVEVSKADLGGR